jgi:NAD-dependent DNA ligase
MSGFNVCYTGVRDKTQELAIVNAGGKIATSVSSKTTHLVTNDPMSTSGKAQKARDLGVQVLGLNDMWNLIKG